MSTKYINNFHTSKYSERTGSLGAARYRRAKFIAEQYCLFEIKIYLIYRHLLNSDVTKRASSRRVFWWSVNERVAHEHALEAFHIIFSVQYRPNRGNRGIHVISTFRVKSKSSITNRTLAHATPGTTRNEIKEAACMPGRPSRKLPVVRSIRY
jgi:hypothetical protein